MILPDRMPIRALPALGATVALVVVLSLLLAALPVFAQAQGQLAGTVVGKDGRPKPNVPVDVLGPSKVYTETDSSGRFSVNLLPGRYVVRVRDGARRIEFAQEIVPGQQQARFQLTW